MQPRIKKSIVNYLNGQKPGKILDIPSGTGWLQSELVSDHWEYHGSDLFTNLSIENFKIVDLNQSLPYEARSFDYIVCAEGLEHIENYHHVLREFFRILKPGGSCILSTPNPLNIKSRLKYYREGTYSGFPHLIHMPKEGEHLHMSPINLSFLISFAKKYGFNSHQVHEVKIKAKNYRFLPKCLWLKFRSMIRYLFKDASKRVFMKQFVDLNILLNDGIVVSFDKPIIVD